MSQPDLVARLLKTADSVEAALPRLSQARRIFLVGTGTSFHGAMVGAHLFRSVGREAWAIPAFEFAHYGPSLREDDGLVLISHRGTKRFSNQTLEGFITQSDRWVVITGDGSPFKGDGVLRTCPQEQSAVHTASHIGAMVRLVQLAGALATGHRPEWSDEIPQLPQQIESASRLRDRVASLAAEIDISRPVHFVGAGPAWSTALEGALKLCEASYVPTVGHELENFLHGPLISVARGQAVIMIAPAGPSLPRAREIVAALAELGAATITVGSESGTIDRSSAELDTPETSELLAPILNVVPLQWLAYEVARRVGVDPDPFRRNEPTYAAALQAAPL